MSREYTIEVVEFKWVYFPSFKKIVVKASDVSEAIEAALDEIGEPVDIEEVEEAKERINEDSYDEMFNVHSNMYNAIAYNYILDVFRDSSYRLLRGYCGKRKCFDLTIEDKIERKNRI